MQLNGFSVSVPQAQEETTNGYVVLNHGQTFQIRLHNSHKSDGQCKPADVEIYVQGKYCGTFRVPYGQTVLLERSTEDDGKFTAYRNGSSEAKQIGLDANSDDNGLIKVVWKPGTKQCRPLNVSTPNIVWPWPYQPYVEPYREPYWTPEPYTITWGDNTTSGCNTFSNKLRSISTSSASMGNSIQCSYTSSNDLCGGGVGISGHSDQNFSETEPLSYDEQSVTIYLRIAFRDSEPRPLKTTVYKVETNIPRRIK